MRKGHTELWTSQWPRWGPWFYGQSYTFLQNWRTKPKWSMRIWFTLFQIPASPAMAKLHRLSLTVIFGSYLQKYLSFYFKIFNIYLKAGGKDPWCFGCKVVEIFCVHNPFLWPTVNKLPVYFSWYPLTSSEIKFKFIKINQLTAIYLFVWKRVWIKRKREKKIRNSQNKIKYPKWKDCKERVCIKGWEEG